MTVDKNGAIIYTRESHQRDGLQMLCQEAMKMCKIKRVCEVGAFMGEASEIFAMYFPEVYCVDTWNFDDMKVVFDINKEELTQEQMEESFDIRHHAAKGKICKVMMPSPYAGVRFTKQFFDLVYIDGCHEYKDVVADILMWKTRCQYLLAGHDFCDVGDVARAVIDELGMPHWLFEDSSWMYWLGSW